MAWRALLMQFLEKFENREEMTHLKCIVYVRPTEENVIHLCRELRRPHYGEYHVYFTNIINRDMLQRIAESDERDVVRRCEEYFGDVHVISPDAYFLRTAPTAVGERVTQGILASLLALKRRPTCVRYQRNSGACQSVAQNVTQGMVKESDLFHFTHGPCVLLVIDRWADPVTPLLLPWTYQAMVHEYITIDRNLIVLDKGEDTRALKKREDNEYVLSSGQDAFFARQQYANWGELCVATKEIADAYQATIDRKEVVMSTGSLDDVKALMQQVPEVLRVKGTANKHLSIVLDIREKMRRRGLTDIGQLEQDIACNSSHTEHWRSLVELITAHGRTIPEDVTRVSMIYLLRYEKNANCNVARLKELLQSNGVPSTMSERLTLLRDRCGADKRQSTALLFPSDQPGNPANIFKIVKNAVKGMESETNVYAQHEPLLKKLVAHVGRGVLSPEQYPVVPDKSAHGTVTEKARELVVFLVGGATYVEAAVVRQINAGGAGLVGGKNDIDVRVVLGTTDMLNIDGFMKML